MRIFTDEEICQITENFSEEKRIGTPGAFGQVYKGILKLEDYPNCPSEVTVKVSKIKNEYVHRMFQQQISALSTISHENVIKLIGHAEALNYYALVYERAARDLTGYIASSREELDSLLVGIASGIEPVHAAGFIHWDIQSRNILLMENGTAKIADFGLATKRNEKMVFFGDRRVGLYNANDTESAQDKYDVFSFGWLMRELVIQERKSWTPTRCARRLLSDRCTMDDPDERPTMEDVACELKVIQLEEITKEEASSSSAKRRKMKSGNS